MNIVNLFARIGLQTDQQKAEKFQSSMKNVRTGMLAATAAATGFSVAVRRLMNDAQDSARELEHFSATTGASSQQLQQWQMAADRVAGAGASVASSIQGIVKNQQQIRLGEGDISGFQLLGIDPRQDPFEILEQLRSRMGGLSSAMQSQVAERIGVSRDLVEVLQMSRDEFDQIADGAPIITGDQIDSIESARAAGETLTQTFRWLKSTIAAELAPSFVDLSERLMSFMQANREGIIEGVQRGMDIMVSFGEAVVNAARITDRAIKGTIGWENAIRGLGVALVWFNRALLFSPIGMFMAAIVGLILVMDDLSAYFNDDDPRKSAFGDLMDRFPALEERFLGFIERFREIGQLVRAIFSGDQEAMNEVLDGWGRFGDLIQLVIDRLGQLGSWFSDRWQGIADKFRQFREWLDDFNENRPSGLEWQGRGMDRQSSLPSTVNNDNRRISVNVNGGDPREVERVFRRVLSETGAQLGAG